MTNKTNSVIDKLAATTGASEPPPPNPLSVKRKNLRDIFFENKNAFQQALPKHIPADRMIRVVMTALNKQPKLLECTYESILGAVLQSCQLGLMPDGITGEAYLIPFENSKKQKDGSWVKVMECQFMPGYRGLITLAYRSQMVLSFQARAVFQSDKFEFEFGLNERLVHIPSSDIETDIGKLTHVYSVVKLVGGGYVFDVMTSKEIERYRNFSKSPNSPAWVNHFAEMAIKTIIRKIAKRCPLSPEFNSAVALDESIDLLGASQNNGIALLDSDSPELAKLGESEFESNLLSEAEKQEIILKEQADSRSPKLVQQTIDLIEKKDANPKQ